MVQEISFGFQDNQVRSSRPKTMDTEVVPIKEWRAITLDKKIYNSLIYDSKGPKLAEMSSWCNS